MKMKLLSLVVINALIDRGAIVNNSDAALLSQSMTIAVGDGASPEVFAPITEVNSIDGPSGQAPEIDVTDLSSTSREFVLGLEDEGEISLDLNFIPKNTQHSQLRTDKSSGAKRNYQITFTDSPATTWTFQALVKTLSVSNAIDAVTKGSATLRVTGSIVQA